MTDRTLAGSGVNLACSRPKGKVDRAPVFGMGGAALALATVLLSAAPSHADVIKLTETGFTSEFPYYANGTLVVSVTATPENDGSYQTDDVTAASATYTVNGTAIAGLGKDQLVQFIYFPGEVHFTFNFENLDSNISGSGLTGGGTVTYMGGVDNPGGASSTRPYTISIVPGSSSAPVPEPSTWMLLGLGAAGIALARQGRKSGTAVLQKRKAAGALALN